MIKAYIEMDDSWTWWLQKEADIRLDHVPSMELTEELFAEYEELLPRWVALQGKLEQLYRLQQGLETWTEPPVPEHKMLEK